MTRTEAQIRAWAMANGIDPATVTATCDGDRIVQINGSELNAGEAMAIAGDTIDVVIATDSAAQAAQSKDTAADLSNADVRVLAAVIELATEIELIKTVIRTIHSATATKIPAKNMQDWAGAIKARAKGLAP